MPEIMLEEPLYSRRPDAVNLCIDLAFMCLKAEFPEGYVHHGLRNAYEFMPLVSTTAIVKDLRNDKKQVSALDVGTGAGGFIAPSNWQPDDTVHGISAYDYRHEADMAEQTGLALTSDSYIIADAQRLDEIPVLLPCYDLVVSRLMLLHLVEPLGTLEQMANRVALGGLLVFDRFRWKSPMNKPMLDLHVILEAFEEGGFSLELEYQQPLERILETMRDTPGIPDMIIRRLDDSRPVRFPVEIFDDELPVGRHFPRAKYAPLP